MQKEIFFMMQDIDDNLFIFCSNHSCSIKIKNRPNTDTSCYGGQRSSSLSWRHYKAL